MLKKIKNYYWYYQLAKYHCKFASGVSSMGKNTKLELEPHVRLGNVLLLAGEHSVGAHTYMRSGGELHGNCNIGRFCSIGSNVIIGLEKNKHPSNWLSTSLFTKELEEFFLTQALEKPTTIGNDCWIGRDAMIMSGVTIGDGAIIGARALVTADVPAFAIYAGIPAKLIRYRFGVELIEKILSVQWWNFSIGYLEELTLQQPELCLEQLKNLPYSALVKHNKIKVTRHGIEL